jgi:uncharacterized protein
MMQKPGNIGKQILVFLLVTFGLSAIFYYLVAASGSVQANRGTYVLGLMWCPAAAAILTVELFHVSWKELGWHLPANRYLVIAYFLPVLYTLIPYGLVWALGLGEIQANAFPAWWYIPLMLTVGIAQSMLSALGEEIGWRGFLVPRLGLLTRSFTLTALISGVIWFLWHLPIILTADYRGAAGVPLWFSLLCFGLLVIGISFPFAWLRLKSGSLWPAALLHASHNLFIQAIFDPLTRDIGITKYLTGEFGALLAVAGVVVGIIFWRLGKQKPDHPAPGSATS